MAEIKLTKTELRDQQNLLAQLEKYLPTLQLKKAMLQSQIAETRQENIRLTETFNQQRGHVDAYSALLSEKMSIHPSDIAKVKHVHKRYENIAGIEVPHFDKVDFEELSYSLFDTPSWLDAAVYDLRELVVAGIKIKICEEKQRAIEKELREVSIRVNLFEKVLIPRAHGNIKKIKVFLGDQQLAAVSQAKVAKGKIEGRKLRLQETLHAV
jgi:V/A-type H+/Na+-transporting ATPase subunit D